MVKTRMETKTVDFPVKDVQGFFYERKVVKPEWVSDMAETIKDKGVLQNTIIAKRLVSNDHKKTLGENIVIAGQLRLLGLQKANGGETIPARIFDELTELEACDIALITNIHSHEMSDADVSDLLQKYVSMGLQQKNIAKRVKLSPSYVSRYLALQQDSEPIRLAISERTEEFTEKHARQVRRLPTKLHKEAVVLVKGKTIKEAKEAVDKIAEKNKKLIAKAKINELKARLKEIDEAEKEKAKVEETVSKLEGKIVALKPKSKDLTRLMSKLERIQGFYFPAKAKQEETVSRLKELKKTLPTYNIEKLKKERGTLHTRIAKLDEKIKALREQEKNLRDKRNKHNEDAKRLTKNIEMVVTMKQEIKQLEDQKKTWTQRVNEYQRNLGKEIKDFKKLKATVNGATKELMEKREKIFLGISEKKAVLRQLNGKIANRTNIEKRIALLEKEAK